MPALLLLFCYYYYTYSVSPLICPLLSRRANHFQMDVWVFFFENYASDLPTWTLLGLPSKLSVSKSHPQGLWGPHPWDPLLQMDSLIQWLWRESYSLVFLTCSQVMLLQLVHTADIKQSVSGWYRLRAPCIFPIDYNLQRLLSPISWAFQGK